MELTVYVDRISLESILSVHNALQVLDSELQLEFVLHAYKMKYHQILYVFAELTSISLMEFVINVL